MDARTEPRRRLLEREMEGAMLDGSKETESSIGVVVEQPVEEGEDEEVIGYLQQGALRIGGHRHL